MKLITINPLDGKGDITVAVQDNAFDYDRLEAFLRDVDELFIKKEYIEQDYAKVILAEQDNTKSNVDSECQMEHCVIRQYPRFKMVEIYDGKKPEWAGWHNLLLE